MGASRGTPTGAGLHPFLIAEALGRSICRLGLASRGETKLTADDVLMAVERGVNFLNWQGLAERDSSASAFTEAVASLGARRESVVVCAQFGARTEKQAADELRSCLAALGTDYVDLLTFYYVERQDEWDEIIAPGGAMGYLQKAKRDGVVRRLGVTSHQRPLAAEMARSGLLDALMIRYNAAHRGAEREIFPVTQSLGTPIIAYTALRWGALVRPTPEDPADFKVPPAPAWYRFVLQHPAVTVTLCAPITRAELDENLTILEASGPLSDEEHAALAAHGERVRRYAGSFP